MLVGVDEARLALDEAEVLLHVSDFLVHYVLSVFLHFHIVVVVPLRDVESVGKAEHGSSLVLPFDSASLGDLLVHGNPN